MLWKSLNGNRLSLGTNTRFPSSLRHVINVPLDTIRDASHLDHRRIIN